MLLAATAASLAAIAACASSEEESTPPTAEAPPAPIPDSGLPDVDVDVADADGDTRLPDCSSAGWCVTAFPDADLDFRDVWPFEDVAFAIADSASEGVKFLEWKKSTNAWEYIDDQSQNRPGAFASAVYAPNEDEVYFASGPSSIYRGKRGVPPETKWTWTRTDLPDAIVGHSASHEHGRPYSSAMRERVPVMGVWGFDTANVYAYFSNTIFRRDPADGSWSAVYTVSDLDAASEHAFFVSAAGTGPDDMWFVGARDRSSALSTNLHCPLVVRKTAAGWERIADGVVGTSSSAPCAARAGTQRVGNTFSGWLSNVGRVSATEYVALYNGRSALSTASVELTHIRIGDSDATDGGSAITFAQSAVPLKLGVGSGPPNAAHSLWRGDGETWLSAWGLVLRGADDGTYSTSTLSRDGTAVRASVRRVRGTSNQNLWAVGVRHAFHKTIP
ncbi:MAG: hypothetical protein BGO98_02265 [Myxococcales bacterium 68-20]|nr:MAG: hypothetical protein BGO98_02265 [Myxococcales bacterium 68-20]